MARYDSADLLSKCQFHARRPTVDAQMTGPFWYALLSDAQPELLSEIAARSPDLLYPDPILMSTADAGLTYTFGNDAAGDAIRPMGHAEIYPDRNSIPDSPLVAGNDYIVEGAKIRMKNRSARLFPSGPYARFVVPADLVIDAATAPIIQPKHARMLLVWKALQMWAARPGSGADPSYYADLYDKGLTTLWTEFATAYNGQAASSAAAAGSSGQRWWTTGDLLRTGQLNT